MEKNKTYKEVLEFKKSSNDKKGELESVLTDLLRLYLEKMSREQISYQMKKKNSERFKQFFGECLTEVELKTYEALVNNYSKKEALEEFDLNKEELDKAADRIYKYTLSKNN